MGMTPFLSNKHLNCVTVVREENISRCCVWFFSHSFSHGNTYKETVDMIKDYILDAAIAGVFLMARTRFHVTSENMALA